MSKTTELVNAIVNGSSAEIQDTFNQAMLSRIADRLDDMRQTVAQGMFNEAANKPFQITHPDLQNHPIDTHSNIVKYTKKVNEHLKNEGLPYKVSHYYPPGDEVEDGLHFRVKDKNGKLVHHWVHEEYNIGPKDNEDHPTEHLNKFLLDPSKGVTDTSIPNYDYPSFKSVNEEELDEESEQIDEASKKTYVQGMHNLTDPDRESGFDYDEDKVLASARREHGPKFAKDLKGVGDSHWPRPNHVYGHDPLQDRKDVRVTKSGKANKTDTSALKSKIVYDMRIRDIQNKPQKKLP